MLRPTVTQSSQLSPRSPTGPSIAGGNNRDEISPGLYSLHVARRGRHGRHLVLYRVANENTIEIVRILHDSMDLSRHVPPYEGGPVA
jgi:toxin ParE1/3/4